ncbi:MAG: class I SAM-dependent rRNA methyltransferase [Pseudomonadota bacterium]
MACSQRRTTRPRSLKRAELVLRKGAERRLRSGHLWVYSNEVDTARNPLAQFEPGEVVEVKSARGDLLGSAYLEPQSLICARLFAPGRAVDFDAQTVADAVCTALGTRALAFDQPYYRLIYGDSDLLPGVVVDRFGDYLVLQLNNAGVEPYEAVLVDALREQLAPRGILLRADSRARRERELPERVEVVFGQVPDQVELIENGVALLAPLASGQKTGWFYDHRMSRARLPAYARDARVLDVYSYVGGWGIQAMAAGARHLVCVDSSEAALAGVMANAAHNGLEARVSTRQGRADEVLAALQDEKRDEELFDLTIIDPPAFIQRRKDLKKGIAAYRRIFEAGLRLTRPGGVVVGASCSMHLSRGDLMFALQGAALRAGCRLQVLEQGAQGPDHPIHPAIPETEYLKAVFLRRL